MEYMRTVDSPLGIITLTACEEGLTGLFLRDPNAQELTLSDHPTLFLPAIRWLEDYFSGQQPDHRSVALVPRGSEFRLMIWQLLLQIPYGQTRTYGDLAKDAAAILGKEKMSAQAVGGAVGHNPISLIIPCHRVVAAGNQLGGFGWGLETKRTLLNLEGGCYDHQ